jgi:hypothetical protein
MSDVTLEELDARLTVLEGMLGAQPDPTAPLWMQNVAYPAAKDRGLIEAIWPASGVTTAGGLLVSPRAQGANLSVDVAAGAAVVHGTDAPDQGAYLFEFDTTNLPLAAPPGAGQERRDLVIVRATDDAVVGDTGRPRGELAIIPGTPGAAGIAPTLPPSSTPLAELGPITINTAQITPALITDRRLGARAGAEGITAYAERLTNQTGIAQATGTLITGLEITTSLHLGRRYRVGIDGTLFKAAGDATGQGLLGIREGNGNGPEVIRRAIVIGQGTDSFIHAERVLPGDGREHYYLGWAYSWASWLNVRGSPNEPAFIYVEDVGAMP